MVVHHHTPTIVDMISTLKLSKLFDVVCDQTQAQAHQADAVTAVRACLSHQTALILFIASLDTACNRLQRTNSLEGE